jgi:hypothetical protein
LVLGRIILIVRYAISIVTILCSILILFFVSIPLFSVEVNELDKKKVIGMKSSVPLEFDNGNLFWWLIRDGNTLYFENSSDEKIKGYIVLGLESNPCNTTENIKFQHQNYSKSLQVLPGKISRIEIPVVINHKTTISVRVNFEENYSCFVNNGDSRNFGAKLVSWSFL